MNKIAGVPETLVAQARGQGKQWALKPIPAGRGKPLTVLRTRLDDLSTWSKTYRRADIIHVHYATNGYYGWGSKPFVLHLHGSDIRKDWHIPVLRQVISHSLEQAQAVLYSTPDLSEHVRHIRPDATWVPNPLPPTFFQTPTDVEPTKHVLFSSRWDDTKGLELLLPLARNLIEHGVHVSGLDWGTHSREAKNIGVDLKPPMSLSDFARFISSAAVVVGQLKYPLLTMTDYQTLALNRPLVCAANIENPPATMVTTGKFEALARDPVAICQVVLDLLDADQPDTRQWVIDNHHPEQSVQTVEEVYKRII